MLINFNEIKEMRVSGMNNGSVEISAKMYMSSEGKIIPCRIHAGGSIGMPSYPTSDDINDILSGKGKAICDGEEEMLIPGVCHICKKGSQHSIINMGNDDRVMLTLVTERSSI